MLTPEMIAAEFGPKWCEPALFNSHPHALRFELGIGEHPIDRFLSAHERALAVIQDAFRGARELHLAVQIFPESEIPGMRLLLQCFRDLRECGLPLPLRDAIRTSQASYDDELWHCIMVMPLQATDLSRVLWAALGHDYANIEPRPRLSAYFHVLSQDLGLLVRPYDDRGMDMIGPNTARLAEVYARHHSWLLSYDLDAMEQSFGRPGSMHGGR